MLFLIVALGGLVLALAAAIVYAEWLARRQVREPELPEVRFLTVDGHRVAYRELGTGPALVLLHGIGASSYSWRYLAHELSQTHRVIALDLLGFGASQKAVDAHYDLDAQTFRIRKVLDALSIDKCIFVGSSMGGTLALWLARLEPSRIHTVIALAPATSPRLVPWPYFRWAKPLSLMHGLVNRWTVAWGMRRVLTSGRTIHSASVASYLAPYMDRESTQIFLLATEALRDPRLPGQLNARQSPTLILWGTRDRMVTRQSISELQSVLPSAKIVFLEGVGHHPHEDAPERTLPLIKDFLTENTLPSS